MRYHRRRGRYNDVGDDEHAKQEVRDEGGNEPGGGGVPDIFELGIAGFHGAGDGAGGSACAKVQIPTRRNS